MRTVPVPDWVYGQLREWITAAGIHSGKLFRLVSSSGIRLALGSTRPQVVRLLLRELIILLSMGLAIGGAATIAFGRSMQALLFGVTPYDPAMLSISGASLTVAALVAGYLASLRAARLNPLDALRQG